MRISLQQNELCASFQVQFICHIYYFNVSEHAFHQLYQILRNFLNCSSLFRSFFLSLGQLDGDCAINRLPKFYENNIKHARTYTWFDDDADAIDASLG